jgi:hypothetical protein
MTDRRRLPASLATTLTLAAFLAACGGSPAASGPGRTGAASASSPSSGGATTQAPGGGAATQAPGGGATVDACTLLTEADIDAVTGNATASSVEGGQFGIFNDGCEWKLVDEDAVTPPTIALGVMTTGGKDYYEQYFAPFNAEYGYEAIEGLGDEAVDADGSMMVVSGDVFFNLQYLGATFGGDDAAVARDLAEKVVANLGGLR